MLTRSTTNSYLTEEIAVKPQTDEMKGSLAMYMKEIHDIDSKRLSREQEYDLSVRIQKGDHKAVAELVNANLRFVVTVAMNYRFQGIPLADLINIGNLGLIKAAHKFDGGKNFKFISYAVWWIRQSILTALADQSRLVRVPLNKVGDLYNLNKAMEKLESRHMRAPSEEELMNELEASTDEIRTLVDLSKPYVSLDKINEDSSYSMLDALPDQTAHLNSDDGLRDCLDKAMAHLNDREKSIIKLYFGLDDGVQYTLEEIGARMDLTRERVRQLRDRALEKLQTSKVKNDLRDHMWEN